MFESLENNCFCVQVIPLKNWSVNLVEISCRKLRSWGPCVFKDKGNMGGAQCENVAFYRSLLVSFILWRYCIINMESCFTLFTVVNDQKKRGSIL